MNALLRPLETPPCAACNGYGTADGLPAGTWARDFGPEDPGPCPACDGTGDARPATDPTAVDGVVCVAFGGAA